MKVSLKLTSEQHLQLMSHLFPGDGKESVAVALCGRRAGHEQHNLLIHKITMIPDSQCSVRSPMQITWPTLVLVPLLKEAAKREMAILKIHSHPGGLEAFSWCDDESDRDLFPSVYGWMENVFPHCSAIMLPDGRIIGRIVDPKGNFQPLSKVAVIGDNLNFWYSGYYGQSVPEFTSRHAQIFGNGTTTLLRQLTIAVVGCSGTGSIVIEQLARLGVGRLILVDPDHIEEKNLNRVLNATMQDANDNLPKVTVMKRAIANMGLGTEVFTFAHNLSDPKVVKAIAESDVVFGCLDSVDGRHLLNRLATFYLLPYFDVGVKLEADGNGGVDQVCGTVHYLQPGKSSLFSRKTYTMEQVRAAGLKRTDPETYREQLKSKYIVGVEEERPAVISVNMQFASLVVNEFLARLHPYRDDENSLFAAYRFSLTQAQLYRESESESCRVLNRHTGRGDIKPLLDMPELSEV